MRIFVRLIRGLVLVLVMAVTALVAWLSLSPPELLKVGTGYAAKIVCSNVFLAGRDANQVLAWDVQAPGHPLLRLVHVEVDGEQKAITARLLRAFVPSVAVYREGLGCAVVPDGDVDVARALSAPRVEAALAVVNLPWPEGDLVEPADPRIEAILADEGLLGPGMRAVVVVKDGRLVGEIYGDGFSAETPLLGWSMTKTVNAALIGRMIADRHLDLLDAGLFEHWSGDERAAITLKSLLAMESGLAFDENYGDVTDVTRMLYLEPDMAAFSAAKPLEKVPGTTFNYSSGTAVLLSRIWMDRIGEPAAALRYPREALFDPLGMSSAVMEADVHGTFVGSSYLYARARDWARFGQFILQDGVWEGERLLPADFVAAMERASEASGGRYTEMQAWKVAPGGETSASSGLPQDTTWLQGHDGQTMAIVPSENLVVLRLGLTPSKLGYRPQRLLKAVLVALQEG